MTIGALAAVLLLTDASPFQELDRKWGDFLIRTRFALGLSPSPDERVFLVGVETSDLVGVRTTETEYNMYAEIVDCLHELQVSSAALDLILVRGGEPDARNVIASIRKSGHVVLGEALTPKMTLRSFMFAPMEFPSGLINVRSDPDGVFRRYPFAAFDGIVCKPSLALATYLASLEPVQEANCSEDGQIAWKALGADQQTVVEERLPTKSVLLNFRSPYVETSSDKNFRYLNVRQLRHFCDTWRASGADLNKIPQGLPKRGSFVIVGAVATGVGDAGATPFGQFEPLVQLHATALSDLLQKRLLFEASPIWNSFIVTLGLGLIALLGRRTVQSIKKFMLGSVLLICGALLFGAILLFSSHFFIAAVTIAGFLSVQLLAESGRRAALTALEKAELGRFFSPRVRDDLLRNPDARQMRNATVTVLLTDLRNFTEMTEQLGVETVFRLLNQVFEVETEAVLKAEGSMEHFVGDQFLAYWGAPSTQKGETDLAFQAASQIIRKLDALRNDLPPEIRRRFGYGVAIHRGKAVFGIKGSQARPDYGILGDTVNAVARIESLTKPTKYGVRQIVTKEALENTSHKPATRFLDRVCVQGRSAHLEIFEVLTDPTPHNIAVAARYEEVWRESYEPGDFHDASVGFSQLAPTDPPSRYMLERCARLLDSKPVSWNGTYTFEEK